MSAELTKKEFLALPMEERRRLLRESADKAAICEKCILPNCDNCPLPKPEQKKECANCANFGCPTYGNTEPPASDFAPRAMTGGNAQRRECLTVY